MAFRVGCGFDAHGFTQGRPLMIGGVQIDHPLGLAGHSDADVLLHAICDALLGAVALGDIGQHFPSTNAAYAGVSSANLLREVVEKVYGLGWQLGNLDCVIIAQTPRMSPYVAQIRSNLAQWLQASQACISVKASTTDHLGFVGRKEGIAAQSMVLLQRTTG